MHSWWLDCPYQSENVAARHAFETVKRQPSLLVSLVTQQSAVKTEALHKVWSLKVASHISW